MKKSFFIILCLVLRFYSTNADETCSRVATINYQEVLVDTNSTQKGEGLKYHLEKDPQAKAYLEIYQKGTQIKWQNALLGTAGTGLVIGGLLATDNEDKKTFLIGGSVLIALNFLVAQTLENSNESNLIRAIEEYNKRNLPRIYLNIDEQNKPLSFFEKFNITIAKNWNF